MLPPSSYINSFKDRKDASSWFLSSIQLLSSSSTPFSSFFRLWGTEVVLGVAQGLSGQTSAGQDATCTGLADSSRVSFDFHTNFNVGSFSAGRTNIAIDLQLQWCHHQATQSGALHNSLCELKCTIGGKTCKCGKFAKEHNLKSVRFTSDWLLVRRQAYCQKQPRPRSQTDCPAGCIRDAGQLHPLPCIYLALGARCSYSGGRPLPVHWLWLPGHWCRWPLGRSDPSSDRWLHERIEDL